MSGWFERHQRAERLAAALREILREADDLDGIARVIDPRHPRIDTSAVPAVLESSARDLRAMVADLLDELRGDLEPAALGFSRDASRGWGYSASPERVAQLLKLHQEESP